MKNWYAFPPALSNDECRAAGSFILGGIFVLALLGVPNEQALAMVLVVEAAHLLSVAALGALSLWWQGISMAELRTANEEAVAVSPTYNKLVRK